MYIYSSPDSFSCHQASKPSTTSFHVTINELDPPDAQDIPPQLLAPFCCLL